MEENDIEYKEASTFLYSKSLPTSHHIDLLRGDNDVMFSSIVKKGTEAKPSEGTSKIVQLVKKDIFRDRSHTIVIFVNPHLETMNSEANAMLTVRRKGIRCENNHYNLKNIPLNYGEVLSVIPGDLHCFHLLYCVLLPEDGREIDFEMVKGVISDTLRLAESFGSQSLKFPVLAAAPVTISPSNRSMELVLETIIQSMENLTHLKIVRILDVNKKILCSLQKTIKTLLK